MTPETILATAATLLASARNASYSPAHAVRDARALAHEVELALRVPDVTQLIGAAHGVDDGNPDGA